MAYTAIPVDTILKLILNSIDITSVVLAMAYPANLFVAPLACIMSFLSSFNVNSPPFLPNLAMAVPLQVVGKKSLEAALER
ncbi:hypothetical protein D3C80_1663680 [compost metagenome]